MNKLCEEDIRKAYVEVLEVLNYIPREEYYKIPKNVIEEMKSNTNSFYKFNFQGSKSISRTASIILTDLYIRYIADNEKKKIVTEILKLNERKQRLN